MKKIICILLGFLLTISLFPLDIIAASQTMLTVSSVSANRGDNVNVKVNISSGSGMQACDFELYYDSDVLEVVSTVKGENLTSSPIINASILGKIVFSYATASAVNTSATMLNIQFKIKANAEYGQSNLILNCKNLSDGKFNDIEYSVRNGYVIVVAPRLEAPVNFEVIQATDTTLLIYWDSIDEATGYNLYINGSLINDKPIYENTYELTGLTPDTEYSLQITTMHYTVESELSEPFSLHTTFEEKTACFFFLIEHGDGAIAYEYAYVPIIDGSVESVPNIPNVPGYTFIGWNQELTNLDENAIIFAEYSSVILTVTFVDWNGTVFSTQAIVYGASAEVPETPERKGYTFTGWDTDFSNVTSDLIVQAVYEKNTCQHEHIVTRNASTSTCAVAGYTGDTYCLDCGELIATGEEIPALGHIPGDWITDKTPTATQAGSRHKECKVCGAILQTEEIPLIDEHAPQIIVESKEALVGKEFNLSIDLGNNPGLAYLKLTLDYDSSAFELISATNVGLLKGTYTTSRTTDVKPYILQWMGADDSTESGELAVLTFKVKDGAKAGNYTISLTVAEAYNSDYEDVAIATQNGAITVQTVIIGDLNGDEVINGKDGILCSQALAGWDVEYSELAADVNGDGKFNGKDGILLSQYLAGWDVVLG